MALFGTGFKNTSLPYRSQNSPISPIARRPQNCYRLHPYPGLRLESLAAAAAAIAAEPQPQAFDPDWYPYRKIRECKRKT